MNGGVAVLRLDDRPQKEANIEEGQPVSETARPASCVCVFCVPDGWVLGVGCNFFLEGLVSLSCFAEASVRQGGVLFTKLTLLWTCYAECCTK
ncbi:hypothetical protein HYQ46_003445 [Verticillium longisporum]|nr:hypothetical protein HYQ46_003445 [Verticillium longisporum]